MKRLEGQRVAGSSAARRSLTRGGVFSAMRSSVSIRLIIAVVYPRWSERAGTDSVGREPALRAPHLVNQAFYFAFFSCRHLDPIRAKIQKKTRIESELLGLSAGAQVLVCVCACVCSVHFSV